MKLESPAFRTGEPIPRKHTGEGENSSPPLRWSDLPDGTADLALICDDPDAPMPQPWVHWVIYDISPDLGELPEGLERLDELVEPPGVRQGLNGAGRVGYFGPMPPPGSGPHRYVFKLYALDTRIREPGLNKASLLAAMEEHIVGQAETFGTYERQG